MPKIGGTILLLVFSISVWVFAVKPHLKAQRVLERLNTEGEEPHAKSPRQKIEAKDKLEKACEESVVGFRRTVHTFIRDFDFDPNKWRGDADVEFVNRLGGVEHVRCSYDFDYEIQRILN